MKEPEDPSGNEPVDNSYGAPVFEPVEPAAPPDVIAKQVGLSPDEFRELTSPKRKLWVIVAIAVMLASAAAVFAYMKSQEPDTRRVLIAVDLGGYWWQGSLASTTISRRFAERLSVLGFEPVLSSDDDVRESLQGVESPEEAARKLKAAFVVGGKLTPEYVKHPIGKGYVEARVRGAIHLTHLGDAPVAAGEIEGWSGASDRERANVLLGVSVADRVFDVGIVALMRHPVIQDILDNAGAVDKGTLSRAKGFVAKRQEQLDKAKHAYERLLKDHRAGEHGREPVEYLGAFDGQETLCAVSPRGVLSNRASITTFYSPDTDTLDFYREPERLRWVGPDGRQSEVVKGFNFYTYPSASADGNTIAYVEDLFSWAKTLTVIERGKPPRRVLVDQRQHFQSPRVSPTGRYAALRVKLCRDCPNGFAVADLRTGKYVAAMGPEQAKVSGYDWAGDDSLNVTLLPGERARDILSETQEKKTAVDKGAANDEAAEGAEDAIDPPRWGIYALDLTTPKATVRLLHEAEPEVRYGFLRAARHSPRVVVERDGPDANSLALYDREANELAMYDVGSRARLPEIAPDGSAAVFEQAGEIVHFNFTAQRTTRLTKNRFRDRYPSFSSDGRTIYYESIDNDPNFPDNRAVGVVASVPAPSPEAPMAAH